MTTADRLPDPVQPEPLAVLADSPITISPHAVAAARAELAQLGAEATADGWSRTVRTLVQAMIAAALLAVGSGLANGPAKDWKGLAWLAGQAVLTALATFVHNRLAPRS